jgi:hypothetical protein
MPLSERNASLLAITQRALALSPKAIKSEAYSIYFIYWSGLVPLPSVMGDVHSSPVFSIGIYQSRST